MRRLAVVLGTLGLTCGGTVAPAPARLHAGNLHVVEMLVTRDGRYVYEPSTLHIRVGDRVRWVNVSGGPHNVAFYRDSVPLGAADPLEGRMHDRMGDLAGPLLFEADAVYEISFIDAPVGTYAYFCTPHELVGMKAKLIVSR